MRTSASVAGNRIAKVNAHMLQSLYISASRHQIDDAERTNTMPAGPCPLKNRRRVQQRTMRWFGGHRGVPPEEAEEGECVPHNNGSAI